MTPRDDAVALREKIAVSQADWLVDAVATATQNRALLKGDPSEDKVLTEALYLNAKQAILKALSLPMGEGFVHSSAQEGASIPTEQAVKPVLAFEQMTAGEDGWSDWVHPEPGYLMACCDCGLVHEVETAVAVNSVQQPDGTFEWEDGQTPENKAVWRMRRIEEGADDGR